MAPVMPGVDAEEDSPGKGIGMGSPLPIEIGEEDEAFSTGRRLSSLLAHQVIGIGTRQAFHLLFHMGEIISEPL